MQAPYTGALLLVQHQATELALWHKIVQGSILLEICVEKVCNVIPS